MTRTPKPGPRAMALLAAALAALTAAPALAETVPELIGGEPVIQVEAGGYHTCALVVSERVWCWGANWFGQLGDGTVDDRLTPVQVPGLTNVRQISVGLYHTCALRDTGRVFCWGRNNRFQLAQRDAADRHTPTVVPRMRQVAQVSAGAEHTCVVLKSGEGFCWGMNASNQLGTRNNRTDRFIPRPIRRATLPMLQVAAGGEMTCFFRERVNGVTPIACRGWDRIYFFTSRLRFVQIQAGYGHVCGLRENGRVACMGRNDYGQFGRGVFGPGGLLVGRTIQDLNRITAVSAGWYHSCALRDTGRIFCWGLNAAGQLGDGTRTDSASPIRVAGPLATDAVQITGGAEHSCLLDTQGRVACWGDNDFGQLGDGTTTDRLRPVRVAN